MPLYLLFWGAVLDRHGKHATVDIAVRKHPALLQLLQPTLDLVDRIAAEAQQQQEQAQVRLS